MFSAGDTTLQDSLIGLALVRGTFGSRNDAAVMRANIAFMLWLPGLLLLLMLSTALESGTAVLVGVPLLLFVLWRFVARGARKTGADGPSGASRHLPTRWGGDFLA